jgi:hypothetical protein
MKVALLVAASLLVNLVAADVYLHNPRGGNDRLDESNDDRTNGNRLWDSQNNDRGGYNVGIAPMAYYEGSQLTIEWTNQHGCGNPKMSCNLVLQYMCSNGNEDDQTIQIRDGSTTGTPTTANFNQQTVPGIYDFGLHEPAANYLACKARNRNGGLFLADQTLNGQDSTFTRQNNNGNNAHGLECPEERDYYPYWHPSPWKDIAVMTDDTSLCSLFQSQSQNVIGKGFCVDSNGDYTAENNPTSCGAAQHTWNTQAAWGIPAPDCRLTPWSRDNHNGNGANGYTNTYNWTIPTHTQEPCINTDSGCNCVLRLRYNISTGDVDGWGFADYTQNAGNSPVKQDDTVMYMGANLTLNINTNQYGRTFQDRSHVWNIRKRPAGVSNLARIFNLNVRGRRGNIVQVYPAVEYDFVPEILNVRVGDYVHFQWTGSNTEPNDAGNGQDQTDRSNIVQISALNLNYPATQDWLNSNTKMFDSDDLANSMAHLDQTNCETAEQIAATGTTDDQNPANCNYLNAASPYWDGGLIKMNNTGTFYYMSTRNNDFTNRGQKAILIVDRVLPVWAIVIVVVGSALFVGSGAVGAAMLYAKSHPHSGVASLFTKL